MEVVSEGLGTRQTRREFERHPLDATVELVHPVGAKGMVLNMSAGGMRIAVDRALETEQHCIAVVHAGDRDVVENIRVVWVEPKSDGWVAGVRFEDIS